MKSIKSSSSAVGKQESFLNITVRKTAHSCCCTFAVSCLCCCAMNQKEQVKIKIVFFSLLTDISLT